VRELLERLQLDDVGQVQAVDLLAGQRTDLGGGVVAEIDVLKGVEVRAAAPVAGLRLEDLLPPDLVLDIVKAPVPLEPTLNSPFSAGSSMSSG